MQRSTPPLGCVPGTRLTPLFTSHPLFATTQVLSAAPAQTYLVPSPGALLLRPCPYLIVIYSPTHSPEHIIRSVCQLGMTPLYDACARGDTPIVKVLLSVPGIDPSIRLSVCAACLLTFQPFPAPARTHTRVPSDPCVQEVGVVRDSNFVDGLVERCGVAQDGSSPLLAAVKGSHDSSVKLLLGAGVDVNAATAVGGNGVTLASPPPPPPLLLPCPVPCPMQSVR